MTKGDNNTNGWSVITELKQFMSSDYLLAGLGYDPEVSAKRLGDGLYEQRLVQQAVVARTGQAFIDGKTSNEAQFKYLMKNAIASKQQLNLAVGVSLSSQQVAALTHDIVWLEEHEEHEVNGEMVLVPVLYLAQADNRLGPTGALIAGNDVSLIAGQNLDNVGTLRAANNLSAAAGNNLVNCGLIEAGNGLDPAGALYRSWFSTHRQQRCRKSDQTVCHRTKSLAVQRHAQRCHSQRPDLQPGRDR